MSNKLMTAAWQLNIEPTPKFVLVALADFANEEQKCWPSIATLSRKCCLSERTVQGAIRMLIGKNLLIRIDRPGHSNMFVFTDTCKWRTPHHLHPAADAPTPAAAASPPPQEVHPEPSVEPKENLQKTLRASVDEMNVPRKLHSEAVDAWNEAAEQLGLSKVQNLTGERQKRLGARLRDCGGIDGWRTALDKLAASPFLLGHNDRGWKANFDWLLKPNSFTRLMENSYEPSGNKQKQSGRAEAGKPSNYERTILAGVTGGR